MSVKNYRDLVAWQKSIDMVEVVYEITRSFPKEESFVLTSQIRRAVISVPANIVEGSSKQSTKDFIRFLNISMGSLKELENHLIISQRLKLINEIELQSLLNKTDEVGRIIYYLRNSLKKRLEAA